MKLTQAQAADVLAAPRHRKELRSVKRLESQLRVVTEDMDKEEILGEDYWTELMQTMKSRSPKKFERVFSFVRYPLPVVQISDSILTDFYKVFEGKNRHFNIDADRDVTKLRRWVETVNLDKWIEDNGKEVYKNKPCSFVVIDKDEAGNPYLVLVDSDRIVDAHFKNTKGELNYIAFIHSVRDENGVQVVRFAVYDTENYHLFDRSENDGQYVFVQSIPHKIGYCPATAFIATPTNSKNPFKRRVAFSKALASQEDWTLFDIYRNYVDHYAPFPVTESAKPKCPNPDCQNGKISKEVIITQVPLQTEKRWYDCPACENKTDHIFPGTHIGLQISPSKETKDAAGIFRMIFPETDALEYTPKKLDDLEIDIRNKTVGLNMMQQVNEAVNTMQLKGSFTSMESVLIRTKSDLDTLWKWIVKTIGQVYYPDALIKLDANFGTEFYLVTEEELQKRFQAAKTAGLPQEELVLIYEQIIDTKYKGNPNKVARQKLLLQLDPLPMYTVNEVINLQGKNLFDPAVISMKLNFVSFVNRFESENAPITQFGTNLSPEARIKKIKQEFEFYNKEAIAKIPKEEKVVETK